MSVAILIVIPVLAGTALCLWLLWKLLKGFLWILKQLFRGIGAVLGGLFGFVRREVVEVARVVGALLTGAVLLPISILAALFGRFRVAGHFARALEDELTNVLLGVYRIGIGYPLRLVGMAGALEGLEGRLPDAFERVPRSAARAHATALDFPGYEVTGTLPGGGSGAQLYLAQPRPGSRASARGLPSEVVIKSFALVQGSTLPQIVRESRALEAAGRLGLVLEHHLEEDRFWYVMRYVRGENLDTAIQRLHARSDADGLGAAELAFVLSWARDLVRSLDRFHAGGLWHKDVKPANLIVAGERAHLVDFGLVTPLASALTLTTHGTEYYRDPELVRLAMQGVKVHEVDGVKFDVYSAGAVLYTMLENSFPAHGSLSRLSKRCPEALTWIVRRAMAEIGTRYPSARAMLADLDCVASAPDPFALVPAGLPSVRGLPPTPVEPAGDAGRLAGAAPADAAADPEPRRASGYVDTRRPVTPGARRFRRWLAAAVVLFGGLLITRRILDGHAHATAVALQHPAVTARFTPAARSAFDAARHALAQDLAGEEQARAQAWNERLAALAPAHAAARALVLDSPVGPLAPAQHTALTRALAAKGFAVLGSRAAGAAAPEGEIDLVGGARLAAGLGGPADEDARARVQCFLDATPEIDVLVWVADEPGTGTIVSVLAPRGAEAAAESFAQAVGLSDPARAARPRGSRRRP